MRTFLFADLRDYTGFVESRGDAAASALIRAFRSTVRAAVTASRGAEIRTEGDSFYVVFASPGEAIRCAMRIQRRAASHGRRRPELPLRIGIGINTGEAVERDGDIVGSAVIVAARLAQQARAHAILVTDTVRSLVRTTGLAPLRDAGAWTLKGVSEPVHVFEVEPAKTTVGRALAPSLRLPAMLQATPTSATSGLVVCPELVQREIALAALLEHLGAAAVGESRIVAVSGEGGIGKSRLVRELAALAQPDGFHVFGGRAHATGAPYEPFVAALRPYAHARGTEVLRRLLGALIVELRRLLPEVELRADRTETGVPDEERRERFLRTIHLLLEDAAAQRPVLLVLEDFHDADVASRDLLRYLAASFRAGICILLTYRDEEVGPAHPLRAVLAELDRDRRLARVPLSPLDRAGVERMTAALLPGRDVSTLARAVYERTEGIPFYVEELLKTALDDPDADPDRLALPRTIADSVRLRVTRLVGSRGAAIADLLETAAVAAVPLGYDLLVRLSERPEADAAADLAAAVEAQLLERPPTTTELYQYRHSLTREAVKAGISPARKRRLHLRVATAIESLGDTGARAALLAHHFSAAGERAKALMYARAGAANDVRVGAYGSAIDLLRDAVAMAAGTNEEPAVLEELAVALQAAGRAAEAEEAIERARHLARIGRDDERLARLDIRLASVLRMQGRRAEAISAVKRAVAALEGRGGPQLAEAVATHAALVWAENDPEQAAALAMQALELAERHGETAVRVRALTVLGASLCRLGNASGREQLEQAIRVGVEEGDVADVPSAYLELSRALQSLGEWEAARATAGDGAKLAQAHGLEFAQATLLTQVASTLYTLGRYREAREALERAATLARPDTVAATGARAMLALTLAMLGENAAALALADDLAERLPRADPDQHARVLGARSSALLGLGRLDEAWAAARGALDVVAAGTPSGGLTFLVAAEILETRREPDALAELIAEFDAKLAAPEVPIARAIRAEMQAIHDMLLGHSSPQAFAAVAAAYDDVGVPVRALYRRATAAFLENAHVPGRAARLEQFRSDLIERGAVRFAAAIDRRMSRAGEKPAAGDPLGEHDLKLALLVARGLTDTRIAAELGLTAVEAARAIRAVLRRLGISRRSQLAGWAVERQRLSSVVSSDR